MLNHIIAILNVWMPIWDVYLLPILCLCFVAFVPKFVYHIVRGD